MNFALSDADVAEHAQDGLERMVALPPVATMGTEHHATGDELLADLRPGRVFMMGDNPALPPMPRRPTLADFFRLRLDPLHRPPHAAQRPPRP